MILETGLFRSHEVATLVLSDSNVPGPGGGGGGGVDIQRDRHTGVTGGHPHVLPSVVATDNWWGSEPRNSNLENEMKFSSKSKNDILPEMVSVSQSPVMTPSLYVSVEVVAVKVEGPAMTIDS